MAKKQTQQRTAAAKVWRGAARDVRPMLAVLAPQSAHPRILRKTNLVFELKYDGIRALVALDGRAPPMLHSRLGRDKTAQFPEIVEPLSKLARRLKRPLLLDGEIVAIDDDGTALPFQHLQGRLHVRGLRAHAASRAVAAALIVFDLLRDGDDDLRPLPFTPTTSASRGHRAPSGLGRAAADRQYDGRR